jgi:hypothetical protein
MLRDQIMQLANSDPKFAQTVDVMEEQVAQMPIVPKDLDKEIQLLEFVLQNPDKYAEVRQAAINDGFIQADMVPEQFDPVFIISLLVCLYGLQDRMQQKGYARGGLKVAARELAAQGRGGDDMLVHVNHREAEMLKRMGGSGDINPNTGLHEYKKKGGILGAILPIALSIVAPGLGTAIGTALGASGTMASALGGALIGAGTSAITGGNPLLGALTGGLMPVASNALFGAEGLTGKLGLTGPNSMFSGMFGEAASSPGAGEVMAPSSNPGGWGAGAPGGVDLPTVGPMPPVTDRSALAALSDSLSGAGSAGAAAAAGSSNVPLPPPRPVEFGGTASPSGSVIDSIKSGLGFGEAGSSSGAGGSGGISGSSLLKLAPLALLASSMGGQQKPAVSTTSMSPEQQAYFNKPGFSWDWDAIQREANAAGIPVTDYISQNWDQVTGGKFNQTAVPQVAAAHGGALNQISRLARGSGSGRDDTINARLSDGEYVIDAETVALLGDGSTDAGAKRLDEMRKQVRMQKGKSLSKGKFSPNAKSPLAYIKGVA